LARSSPAHVYLVMRAVNSLAFALVFTYELVYHTVVVGLTPFQLVLVGVVLEAMTFFFELPTGIVADLYSRRLSVILGILLTGCGFLIEALVPLFGAVLLAQVIWGIGFTFYSGAEAAWVTDELGVERAHGVFLQGTQISQVCSIVGTFLGAGLSQISIPLPVIVGAVMMLLLGIGLCFTMPETGFRPMARDQQQHLAAHLLRPLRESVRAVRIHPMIWMILLLGFIIGLCIGGFDRLYTPHILRDLTLPDLPLIGQFDQVGWLGLINGVVNICSLIGMELVRRRSKTTDQAVIIRLLTRLYIGMIIGSFVFALSGTFALAVLGFCLSQTLRNIGRPLLILWINQNAEREIRATVISAYWQSNGFGQMIGSPILGWIGTVASLKWALAIGTAVYTVTIPLLAFAQRRWRQVQDRARMP
jgi:DHA3 family tetracycline resistance protein-like MFS transporter